MRTFVLLLATVATFYFVFWLPFWFLLPIGMSTAVRLVGARQQSDGIQYR